MHKSDNTKSSFSSGQDNIWSIESVKLKIRKLDSAILNNIPFHTVKSLPIFPSITKIFLTVIRKFNPFLPNVPF